VSPDKEQLLGNGPATGMTAELEMEVSGRFLAIVRDLVWELHPHLRRAVHVELDSDFDRDLALDSLGRAELILRVDRAFKVRLPDQLLSEADTPRELLMAVLSAGPERRALPEIAAMTAAEQPEISAPVTAQTLIDALEHHVHAHGRRLHLCIWRGEGDETCVSYDDLREAACRIASGLLELWVIAWRSCCQRTPRSSKPSLGSSTLAVSRFPSIRRSGAPRSKSICAGRPAFCATLRLVISS
jgi:acyl carrier protein